MKQNCQVVQVYEYASTNADLQTKNLLNLSWDKQYNITRHVEFTAFPCKGSGWHFVVNATVAVCQKSCLEDHSCDAWIWTSISTGMEGNRGCHQAASGAGIEWQWCEGVDLDSAGIMSGQIVQRGDIIAKNKSHTGRWAVKLVNPPIEQNGVTATASICRSLCSSSWDCHAWLLNSQGCWLEDKANGHLADDSVEAQDVIAGETIHHVCKWHELPGEERQDNPDDDDSSNVSDGPAFGPTVVVIGVGAVILGGFATALTHRIPMWCCSPLVACRGYLLGRRDRVTSDLPIAHPAADPPPEGRASQGAYRVLSLVQHELAPPLSARSSLPPSSARSSDPLIE